MLPFPPFPKQEYGEHVKQEFIDAYLMDLIQSDHKYQNASYEEIERKFHEIVLKVQQLSN